MVNPRLEFYYYLDDNNLLNQSTGITAGLGTLRTEQYFLQFFSVKKRQDHRLTNG